MYKYIIWKNIMCVFLPIILFAEGANWIFTYEDSCGSGLATSAIYGADDNIYTAGYCWATPNVQDLTVISLTTAGDTNWVYRLGGWHYNGANSMTLDPAGNIYVAGRTDVGPPVQYFTVVSLTPTGIPNWIYKYYSQYHADFASSVIYGADGNIYAGGATQNSGYQHDFTVISLTPGGDTNWVYIYSESGGVTDYDCAHSVIYGSDGNVYAAGRSDTGSCFEDFTVVSLTPEGNTNWVYLYDGPANSGDVATSVIYGADSNIYAAGYSYDLTTLHDITVISLTTDGDTNWLYRYNGPGNDDDRASSIIYGDDGNIYVTGRSTGIGSGYDIIVISLTTAGDVNWVQRYNGPGNANDIANRIIYGANDYIYTTGQSTGNGTGYDFTVIRLTTAGSIDALYRYNGQYNDDDYASPIVQGTDNTIYAGGGGTCFTVISLPPDLGVNEVNNNNVKTNTYGSTIFSGPLILPEGRQYTVFDITGRTVTPDNMEPGVYFLQIDNKTIQKVVKIR